MGFEEGETDCCSETCVMYDVDGTEEFSTRVEEAVDIKDEIIEAIKDEIPEPLIFPLIKTEREVSHS
jgi:hypothetical protein